MTTFLFIPIGVFRVSRMGAMHPPFIFAPRCRIGCKKIVFLHLGILPLPLKNEVKFFSRNVQNDTSSLIFDGKIK